ncbi:unnamed protein product [Moneuplotes crassus]|uniref:Uncharacterized protein n=1 Tax=Euplotes crassus TaxID=5936 RepID=A0AAD1YD16_EUPCR|nr:unnamed protein product [Moneuplotes crassus]
MPSNCKINSNCFLQYDNLFKIKVSDLTRCRPELDFALACIYFKKGKYWLFHSQDFDESKMIESPNEQIWLPLKNPNRHVFKDRVTNYGYQLRAGDIIRFGRVRFYVKKISSHLSNDIDLGQPEELSASKITEKEGNIMPMQEDSREDSSHEGQDYGDISNNNITMNPALSSKDESPRKETRTLGNERVLHQLRKSYDSSLMFESYNEEVLNEILEKKESFTQIQLKRNTISYPGKERNENSCRICLDEEFDDQDNPMISPCKCTGSVKQVHLECLKEWIQNKRNIRNLHNTRSFNWKDLKCELCKSIYENEFYHKSKRYKLLNYEDEMTQHYLVLESYTHTPTKTIHICEVPDHHCGNLEFDVGRSSGVSVRITDISVSRVHARITFHDGKFYVKDMASKFGTVTRLWHPISIPNKKNYKIDIQIGRSSLTISPLLKTMNRKIGNKKFTFSDEKDVSDRINDKRPEKVHTEMDLINQEKYKNIPASFKKYLILLDKIMDATPPVKKSQVAPINVIDEENDAYEINDRMTNKKRDEEEKDKNTDIMCQRRRYRDKNNTEWQTFGVDRTFDNSEQQSLNSGHKYQDSSIHLSNDPSRNPSHRRSANSQILHNPNGRDYMRASIHNEALREISEGNDSGVLQEEVKEE